MLTFVLLASNLLSQLPCTWSSLREILSFYDFPISSKSYARDGQTDRRVQRFVQPPERAANNK